MIGANPIWDNSGYLYVGRYGEGMVTIENGGRVENTNGYIGIYADAVGTVTVTGTGSTWDNNDDLYVGGWYTYRGTANISVQNGGTISLNGGTLRTSTLSAMDGTIADKLLFNSGELNLTGPGGLVVDANGPLGATVTVYDGQTLRVDHTTAIPTGGTFSGVISESGNVTKTGAGTQTLSGTMTIDGTLNIYNGFLVVQDGTLSTSTLLLDGGSM